MSFSRSPWLSISALASICAALAGALLLGAFSSEKALASAPEFNADARFAPALGREKNIVYAASESPPSPIIERLRRMEKVTAHVRDRAYHHIHAHPLIVEAASLLSTELSRYTRAGAYVTSLVRSPEDQWRLKSAQRYRWWTTERSKHLMGMAADIGFARRRISMRLLAKKAEILLQERFKERAYVLRIVREAHCLHIEIDTRKGRAILEARAKELENLGIAQRDGAHPVPSLLAYRLERSYLHSNTRLLLATLD